MKFLIFIPPNNFRDESVSTFKMFFDRWGIESQISSYSTKNCEGAHGATYKPDINTNRVDAQNYDGIVLIDGPGIEAYKLYEFRPFFDVLAKFNAAKKYIFAVANAQRILAKANLIKGKKMAAPEDQETQRAIQLFHGLISENEFEIDGNIITFKSTTAIEGAIHPVLEHIGIK